MKLEKLCDWIFKPYFCSGCHKGASKLIDSRCKKCFIEWHNDYIVDKKHILVFDYMHSIKEYSWISYNHHDNTYVALMRIKDLKDHMYDDTPRVRLCKADNPENYNEWKQTARNIIKSKSFDRYLLAQRMK